MTAAFLRRVVPKRFRPIGYLEHLVEKRTGRRIAAGPFSGMHYIRTSVGSAYVPKLLGMYERELNDCVEQACARQFPLIIDIGAAEGYYAVGLARRNPHARVIAFEMEAKGRAALKEMAQLNNLADRVEIRGKCEMEDLRSALTGGSGAFVVCDAEGYEENILRPDLIPELSGTHLLVEMHDFLSAGISERMSARFAHTHRVKRIWQESRSRAEFPHPTLGTMLLPRRYLDWAVSEWRPERMSWLWMTPKPVG